MMPRVSRGNESSRRSSECCASREADDFGGTGGGEEGTFAGDFVHGERGGDEESEQARFDKVKGNKFNGFDSTRTSLRSFYHQQGYAVKKRDSTDRKNGVPTKFTYVYLQPGAPSQPAKASQQQLAARKR